jgi:choline dehydrogenase-like flavoprotein
MHSGIGPPEQLRNYGIHVIQNIFSVGKNLRDRPFCLVAHGRKGDSTDRPSFYGNQQSMDVALEQWKIDGTGPWSVFACQGGIGYFKINDVHAIGEFQKLSLDQQEFIQAQTVPHYEIETHFPAHWFLPNLQNDMSYAALVVFLMNCQSQGEVVLQSPDPSVPLLFDPKFLSHPFDRRLAIESLKEVLKVINHPVFAKDTVCEIAGPKSASEDDLLDYWRRNLGSTYHMAGTAKMGKQGDPSAVVDPAFRVFGVHGLRVADMSVVPILPNCHPQTTAYVTGMTCAEKLITEYNLA